MIQCLQHQLLGPGNIKTMTKLLKLEQMKQVFSYDQIDITTVR